MVLKNTVLRLVGVDLPAESVKGTAGLLKREDHVQSSDSLAFTVLGVSDGITNQVLEKELKHGASLFVDCFFFFEDESHTE